MCGFQCGEDMYEKNEKNLLKISIQQNFEFSKSFEWFKSYTFFPSICRIKDWPKWLFYTWVCHGKRLDPEGRKSFTITNPGKKKPFGPVFCHISSIY